MPDYAACMQTICTKRHNCVRYRMVPDEYRQTYIAFETGDDCDGYWDTKLGHAFKIRSIADADKAYTDTSGKETDKKV